jgi:transcriptional regulator with XRE-family HTH domain
MERSPDSSFLGQELRRVRLAAGIKSQEELAEIFCVDRSVISKIESGKPPSPELARLYAGRFPELAALVDGGFTERWAAHVRKNGGGPFPSNFVDWVDEERTARSLLYWAPILVPGICQTESYARAMLVTEPHDSQSPEERLAGRMQRQEILSRPGQPTITVIMSELVLWRNVGGLAVMHEQVTHLHALGQQPKVIIQVIPADIGAHAGLAGPVSLADHDDGPAAIYADAFALGQVTKDADTVSRVREMIELLRCEALPRTASLELIRETAEERWKLT